jgi:hypothetical protein
MTRSVLLAAALAVSALSSALARGQTPVEFAEYTSWGPILKEPHMVPIELAMRCVAPTDADWAAARATHGPHTERVIRVWGNPAAVAALKANPETPRFPVGVAIAKGKFTSFDDRSARGVGIMVKRSGPAFAETGGWEFLYQPDGPDPAATHRACASCRQRASRSDLVFGRYGS